MSAEGAQVVVGLLNKVIKYAVGLGVGASVLQTTLYNGAPPGPRSRRSWRPQAPPAGRRGRAPPAGREATAAAAAMTPGAAHAAACCPQSMAASARSCSIASGEC